jgi:hypothetical protein
MDKIREDNEGEEDDSLLADEVVGLVLDPTGQRPGEYRRVGKIQTKCAKKDLPDPGNLGDSIICLV